MTGLDDFRTRYPQPDADDFTPDDLDEIVSRLRTMSRHTEHLTASVHQLARLLNRRAVNDALPEEPQLKALSTRINRLCGHVNTFLRTMHRRDINDSLPAEQKSRIPKVMKTMTTPGESLELLLGARAALVGGPAAYARYLEQRGPELAAD